MDDGAHKVITSPPMAKSRAQANRLAHEQLYLNSVPASVLPRGAPAAAFDIIVRFIETALRTLLVAGLVVAAGAFFTGPSAAAARVRGWFTSGLGSIRRRGDAAGVGTGPTGQWTHSHRAALRIGRSRSPHGSCRDVNLQLWACVTDADSGVTAGIQSVMIEVAPVVGTARTARQAGRSSGPSTSRLPWPTPRWPTRPTPGQQPRTQVTSRRLLPRHVTFGRPERALSDL